MTARLAGRGLGARVVAASVVLVLLTGCGVRSPGAERFPHLAEHENRRIRDVQFVQPAPFTADTLQTLIQTQPSRCSFLGLPLCVPLTRIGRQTERLNLGVLGRDVDRLANFYRRKGFFGTVVSPDVDALTADDVRVRFDIRRAPPVVLDSLGVEGTEGILDPDSLARTLPLQPGAIFDLDLFNQSAEIVLAELRDRGHAYAELLRNYGVDTIARSAVASLEAVPGPRVVVDSILVFGATHLGRASALRQLPFREGDVLNYRRLVEGHRNLYSLELVQLATVRVAPAELQVAPEDSTRATVEVRIAEAPPRQIDAAVGYGTVECFRTEAQWVNRSFLGGARRLAATGNVSRIGIASPTDAGLAGSLCPAFRGDEAFADALDYRFTLDFTQPYFISPRNHLTAQLFTERISEPNVFQRVGRGGSVALNRRIAPRTILTGGIDVEYGGTAASPALYCVAFQICVPEMVAALQRARYKNMLTSRLSRDRTDVLTSPTRGYVFRTSVAWAPEWLLSEVSFLRWTGEAAVYREIAPRWVAAASARFGNFFGTVTLDPAGNFLPPEERFFAGGASTVRGFERNALGPGVYVTDQTAITEDGDTIPDTGRARFVPIGGTALGIANAELRFPSPFLSNVLRLVVFVDAGAIADRPLWEFAAGDWRVTPGAGLRFHTPVGPIRVDIGFNPYDPAPGPLFLTDPVTGTLVRVQDDFQPGRRTFLERLRLHAAIGQAF